MTLKDIYSRIIRSFKAAHSVKHLRIQIALDQFIFGLFIFLRKIK